MSYFNNFIKRNNHNDESNNVKILLLLMVQVRPCPCGDLSFGETFKYTNFTVFLVAKHNLGKVNLESTRPVVFLTNMHAGCLTMC